MTTRTRSEFAANVALSPDTFRAALSPDTLQAMRNFSALQAMRANNWTVGRTFTRAAPIRPAAHTAAKRENLQESVNACSRAMVGYAMAIGGAVSAYLVLISF